jgi:cobalt/nickel transport system permease protein
MGVLGAFVFAAQMINFPVPGGTSGHLLGGVLLSLLLGPAVGSVVLFCVFVVQALLFQDGGITVLGANFINMGLSGTLGGWLIVRLAAKGRSGLYRDSVIFMACWLSVVLGSLLVAGQLWLSGNAPLIPVMVTMGSVHAFIGLGEGLITVACLRFLLSARPSLAKNLP